jgi:hypothetical protein
MCWSLRVVRAALAASLVAALLVLRVCYRLNMRRVAAFSLVAGMIRLCTFRHRAVEMLPNKAIWRDSNPLLATLGTEHKLPVTVFIVRPKPRPAVIRAALVN